MKVGSKIYFIIYLSASIFLGSLLFSNKDSLARNNGQLLAIFSVVTSSSLTLVLEYIIHPESRL